MSNLFNLNVDQLRRLHRFSKNSPRQFQKVAAYVLNEQAFQTRAEAIAYLKKTTEIRSSGFLNSSMRFKKTRIGPINTLKAQAGSIQKARSDGFEALIKGSGMPTRMATLFTRGDSPQKIVARRYRLKSGKKIWRTSDFGLGRSKGDVTSLIRIMQTKKHEEYFYIPFSHGRMSKGIYLFSKMNQIRKVHDLEASKRKVKKRNWLKASTEKQRTQSNIADLWAKKLREVLKY